MSASCQQKRALWGFWFQSLLDENGDLSIFRLLFTIIVLVVATHLTLTYGLSAMRGTQKQRIPGLSSDAFS